VWAWRFRVECARWCPEVLAVEDEAQAIPSLIRIDGGLGQLHVAAMRLKEPWHHIAALASIAKGEVIYLYGMRRACVLDRLAGLHWCS